MYEIKKQRLGRLCKRCDGRYIPTGRHSKYCGECQEEANRVRQIKISRSHCV